MRTILLYILILSASSVSAQMQMRLRGTYEPVYVPNQLDSLFYWFAADRSVLDSAGTSIEDYEGVGTWADLSGRNHDVFQTVATKYPQYRTTGGPNGYPALYFDGTDDFLASAAHWWESDDLTVFVVYKMATATPSVTNFISSRYEFSTNNRQFYFGYAGAAVGDPFEYRTSSNGTTTAAIINNSYDPSTTYSLLSLHADGTTTGVTIYSNGNSVSGNSGSVTATMHNVSIPLVVGSDGASPAGNLLNGYISEIIVYSRALTASERIGVESYLKNKYAL